MLKTVVALQLALFCSMAAEPLHKILTSQSDAIHIANWEVRGKPLPKGAFIKKTTLHGGKQEGVDVITVNNGKLTFTVIPTRGMGIAEANCEGVRLAWNSPVKEIVHPNYVNLQSRGGLGWLEGFNEFMVRCGLEWAGHPGKDKFINNTGDEAEMDLTLHGKIGNTPATQVEVFIEGNRIHVRGVLNENMFYGPKLRLVTDISTEFGSNQFRIEDAISNKGAFDQEYEMIYHSNYGAPLLENGSRFFGAFKQVTPFNANAAKGNKTFDTYAGPTKGFIEQVYCIRPLAGGDGRTTAMLQNAAGNHGVSMTWRVDQLPYFTLWKNTAATEDGYVTGLEPGTSFPMNRRIERQFGRVPKLKPTEERRMVIDYAVLGNSSAVAKARDTIKAIQGSTAPQIDAAPAPLPQ